MKLSKFYRQTSKEIRSRGWGTGSLFRVDGSVCLLGGMLLASDHSVRDGYEAFEGELADPFLKDATSLLAEVIEKNVDDPDWPRDPDELDYHYVYEFNDGYAANEDEVVLMLELAAKKAEEVEEAALAATAKEELA